MKICLEIRQCQGRALFTIVKLSKFPWSSLKGPLFFMLSPFPGSLPWMLRVCIQNTSTFLTLTEIHITAYSLPLCFARCLRVEMILFLQIWLRKDYYHPQTIQLK